jgi:hypothetical protein
VTWELGSGLFGVERDLYLLDSGLKSKSSVISKSASSSQRVPAGPQHREGSVGDEIGADAAKWSLRMREDGTRGGP